MYVRNYQPERRWLHGVVQDKTGPVSLRVKMQDSRLRRCHFDQVCSRSIEEPSVSEVPNSLTDVLPNVLPDPPVEIAQPSKETCSPQEVTSAEENLPQASESSNVSKSSTAVKVYPSHTHKLVDQFEPTRK